MPQVSIVMPVYNSEKFLAEAIDSILQQTLTDFEFIIVDDGSTDRSLAIIQDYAERDQRIRYFQHAENNGNAVARNTGITHASGKYVAQMDSDDVSLPQRLEKQVAHLETEPDIGAVSVYHRVCANDLTPIIAPEPPARHYSILLNFLLYTKSGMKCAPIMVRREHLDIQPVYDPSYVVGTDADHVLRLVSEKHVRFAHVQEILYLFRRHEMTMGSLYRPIARKFYIQARSQALRRLGARGRGVEWLLRQYPLGKLSWSERRRARRDITRLIEALVEHNWVDAEDEPLLYAEMRQLVESASPRYWQMFLHWYRHRVVRHIRH